MAPNPRLFKACVISLALLFAGGASAQTQTADEQAPVASPEPRDPARRDAPAAEPRESPQRSAPADAPSRGELRVETPVTEPLRSAPEPILERTSPAELA